MFHFALVKHFSGSIGRLEKRFLPNYRELNWLYLDFSIKIKMIIIFDVLPNLLVNVFFFIKNGLLQI